MIKMKAHAITNRQTILAEQIKAVCYEAKDLETVAIIAILSNILGQIISTSVINNEYIQLGIEIAQRNVEEGLKEGMLNKTQLHGNA